VSSHPERLPDATIAGPIDQRLIAPLRDLGRDDFCELIRLFLDEAAGRVARLQTIQQQGEAPELAGVAHALRGTSAAFGATELAVLCAEIEGVTGTRAADDMATLVRAVADEFERVRTSLTDELS
jgi:HPt (histidine-containing phosphotransfer) domain-containing protein